MEIKKISPKTLTATEKYALTKNAEIKKMRNAAGQTLEIAAYIVYEDVNNNGEVQTVCSIKTSEGDVYATNSPTFVREFLGLLECYETSGEELKAVKVIAQQSKKGRTFITCGLA